MPSNETMIRRTILFSGRVQGVGFRATAQHAAVDFDVAGYVRNLPDGRVELVADGEQDELNRFQQAVERALARHIDAADASDAPVPAGGAFSGFHIRF